MVLTGVELARRPVQLEFALGAGNSIVAGVEVVVLTDLIWRAVLVFSVVVVVDVDVWAVHAVVHSFFEDRASSE